MVLLQLLTERHSVAQAQARQIRRHFRDSSLIFGRFVGLFPYFVTFGLIPGRCNFVPPQKISEDHPQVSSTCRMIWCHVFSGKKKHVGKLWQVIWYPKPMNLFNLCFLIFEAAGKSLRYFTRLRQNFQPWRSLSAMVRGFSMSFQLKPDYIIGKW